MIAAPHPLQRASIRENATLEEEEMSGHGSRAQRRRIERGIYEQNGRFMACVVAAGHPRFRALKAETLVEARTEREQLAALAAIGQLPISPRVTFAEVARRWLSDFEAKATLGLRRERTAALYASQLRCHLLPRLGRRTITSITTDDAAALVRELERAGLSPWTVKRILGELSCVLSYALRRGYICEHPLRRLERDERPHPLPTALRVLSQDELARLLRACPARHRALIATGVYTGMRLS